MTLLQRFKAWRQRRRNGGFWQYVRTETIEELMARRIRIEPRRIYTTRRVYRWRATA